MKLRKLILSGLSTIFLTSTLVTATYAYVVLDTSSDVREFEFNVEGTTGLLVSLDGINFSQDISNSQITEYILTSAKESNSSLTSFEELKFTGVTPKLNETNNVLFTNNTMQFQKDITVSTGFNSYEHRYIDAVNNIDYISFDLYFKVIDTNNKDNYNLYITNNSYITGQLVETTLVNKLTTSTNTYNSGDKISVNPQNAMRLAISELKDNSLNTNYYEIIDSNNLGSTAIEGSQDTLHNPNLNAMYTYYNNCFPNSQFIQAATDNESFNTKSSYSIDDNDYLSQFIYDTNSNDYNIIHTKLYLYLEGWDSDYFMGLPLECNKLNIGLQFEIKKS